MWVSSRQWTSRHVPRSTRSMTLTPGLRSARTRRFVEYWVPLPGPLSLVMVPTKPEKRQMVPDHGQIVMGTPPQAESLLGISRILEQGRCPRLRGDCRHQNTRFPVFRKTQLRLPVPIGRGEANRVNPLVVTKGLGSIPRLAKQCTPILDMAGRLDRIGTGVTQMGISGDCFLMVELSREVDALWILQNLMIGESLDRKNTFLVLFSNCVSIHHHAPIGTTITASFVGLSFANPVNQIVCTKDMLPKTVNTGFAKAASMTFKIGSTCPFGNRENRRVPCSHRVSK